MQGLLWCYRSVNNDLEQKVKLAHVLRAEFQERIVSLVLEKVLQM